MNLFFVIALCFLSFVKCQTNAPIDLYLVFDQSGSLSERQFRVLLDFGEALTFGVANITGLYNSQADNGLRLGAVTFGCQKQTKIRVEPSGDESYIRERFDHMRSVVVTYGDTCLEEAFQLLNGFKRDSAAIEPPSRRFAMVVLSDGRFDDFGVARNVLAEFKEGENSNRGFSVGIGSQVRESDMIEIADDNPDHYFHVDDVEALQTLILLIASGVIDDIVIDPVLTSTQQAVDDTLCVGESVSVKVAGSSVQVFSESSQLYCQFTLPDQRTVKVYSTLAMEEGQKVFYCSYPDYLSQSGSAIVDVYIDNVAMTQRRSRIATKTFEIARNDCSTVTKYLNGGKVDSFSSCWGASDGRIEVTGESAVAFANNFLSGGTETLACNLGFLSAVSNVEIYEVVESYVITEDREILGFACVLPDLYFLQDKVAGSENFTVSIATEALGKEIYKSLTINSVPQVSETCFRRSLLNQENSSSDFCYGDVLRVQLEGESVEKLISKYQENEISDLSCGFASQDVGTTTAIIVGESRIDCQLPFVSSMQQLEVPAVNVRFRYAGGTNYDQFSAPLGKYELETCLSPQSPQAFVVESPTERVLDGRFCAGDGYEIEYSGRTVKQYLDFVADNSLNLRIMCDFFRKDDLDAVLFTTEATLLPEEDKVICKNLLWDPFLPENKEYYDLVEVELYIQQGLVAVSDSIDKTIGNGEETSICFDEPDHNVPPGFEPPALVSNSARSLQEDVDCFPFCCQRFEVSISFTGRTIAVISASENQNDDVFFRCVYEGTDGQQTITSVVLEGNKASCEGAPGWRLSGQSGDYSSVRLELVDGDNVSVFGFFSYTPTSGSQTCVNVGSLDYYCLGQSVFFTTSGLTLLAIDLDPDFDFTSPDLYNVTLFDSEVNSQLNMQVIDEKTLGFSWQKFDFERVFTGFEFDMNINGEDFLTKTIAEIAVDNRERCLATLRSATECTAFDVGDAFLTNLVAEGESVDIYPPDEGTYSCKFFNPGDNVDLLPSFPATVDEENNTVICELNEQTQFSLYQILYTNSTSLLEILLVESTLNETVTGNCEAIGGAGDDNDPFDFIPFFLPIALILLLVAFILLFVMTRRRNGGSTGSSVGAFSPVAFDVGGRVEIFLPVVALQENTLKKTAEAKLKPEEIFEGSGEGFWFKGTVSAREEVFENEEEEEKTPEDAEEGIVGSKKMYFLYTIDCDDFELVEKTQKKVERKSLRAISSDFKVSDKVSAKVPDSEEVSEGEVLEVLPNDVYKVSFASLNQTYFMSGSELKLLLPLLFKEGDIVHVKSSPESKSPKRAKITSKSYIEQKYGVSFVDFDEETDVISSLVSAVVFLMGDIVQVQSEDDENVWKRAKIVKTGEKYDVLHSSGGKTVEPNVSVDRLRYPVFVKGQKVEVLKKKSEQVKAEDWEPAVVEKVIDSESSEVLLTRKNELSVVQNELLRPMEMDEVIQRIRQGVPMRSANLAGSVPEAGEGIVPIAERFKTLRPVDYTELPAHQFDITIPSGDSLGVKFGWTNDKKVIVAGFKDLPNGDWGPLEATGLVMLKDQLIRINGQDVSSWGISDISELVEKSKQAETITLRFGRSEDFQKNLTRS